MKSYTIYLKESTEPVNDAVYIPEGFSFWAFLFNIFWLLYQRLWLHTIIFTGMYICITEMGQAYIIDTFIASIAYFCIWVYIGYNGRDYLRGRMEKEGYKLVDIVVANSVEEAEFKFITKYMEAAKRQQEQITLDAAKSNLVNC